MKPGGSLNKDISLKLEQISENANYHILAKMKYRIDLKTKTKALLQMINPLQKEFMMMFRLERISQSIKKIILLTFVNKIIA